MPITSAPHRRPAMNPVNFDTPYELGLYPDGGAVVLNVTFWDENRDAVPITANAGGAQSSAVQATLAYTTGVATADARSLAALLAGTYDAATNGIPPGAYGGQIEVVSGALRLNGGGSKDGTGTHGFAADADRPNANTPGSYGAGEIIAFGRR